MPNEKPSSGPPNHTQKSANLAAYFETSERLFREWMPHLTEGELKLIGFVLTQTLGRGNSAGHYTEDQVLNGIPKSDGTGSWGAGTGLSSRSFYRAKKSAVERGLLIEKTGRGAGYHFAINQDWKPLAVNVIHGEDNVVGLKLPKQTKKQPSRPFRSTETEDDFTANLAEDHCQFGSHPNINPSEDKPKVLTTFEPPADDRQPEVVSVASNENSTEAVVSKFPKPFRAPRSSATPVTAELPSHSNKSSQHKRTNSDGKISPETAWKDAWKEAHASKAIAETRIPAPWTIKDRKIVETVARKWDEAAYGKFPDFLTFVVCNWKTILRKHFAWMTQSPPPEQPTVGFLVNGKFLPKFIEAYCNAETLKWVGLDPRVGREVEWQMENGLSREAAILKVAQMHMEEADRKQRATDIASAKRLYEMAQISLSRARAEAAARDKYRPAVQEKESFAPAVDRDPDAPIIAEHADFSAWDFS